MKIFFLRYVPVLFWMALMFFISSRTNLPVTGTYTEDFLSKKLAHVFEYTILMFLMYRAVGQKSPAGAFLYALIFAFTDETHQLFIPTRSGMLRDVGIDSLGLLISSFTIIKLRLWNSSLLVAPQRKPGK